VTVKSTEAGLHFYEWLVAVALAGFRVKVGQQLEVAGMLTRIQQLPQPFLNCNRSQRLD